MTTEEFRVRPTPAGPVVLVPLLGARWLARDRRYWLRRVGVTVLVVIGSAQAVLLTVVFVRAIARSGTAWHEALATVYALLSVPGLWYGHRWVTRSPSVRRSRRDGALVSTGLLVFFFMPFLAGLGVAVTPRLFHRSFPGESRAAELTTHLRTAAPTAT